METSYAEDRYLVPGDVARLLCVSARTVSRWADQGRIPHLVTLGGHRRFRRSDVANLVELAQRDCSSLALPAISADDPTVTTENPPTAGA